MQKTRLFRDVAAEWMEKHLNYDELSAWPTQLVARTREIVVRFLIKEFSPWIYLLILMYSLLGTLHYINQFSRANLSYRPLTIFRTRILYGHRYRIIQNMRILGCFIMLICWSVFFLGLLLNKPNYFIPWLKVVGPILIVDFCLWLVDLCLKSEQVDWKTLMSFVVFFICHIVVKNLRTILDPSFFLQFL